MEKAADEAVAAAAPEVAAEGTPTADSAEKARGKGGAQSKKAFLHTNGKLTGMSFDKVRAVRDEKGRRQLVSTGEPEQVFECDDVLVAVGQENAFPWIERDAGIAFDEWGMPVLDATTLQSSLPSVFFGGDAALGPKNIIWAVAQGHAAAISIDKFLHGEDVTRAPAARRHAGVAEDGHPRVELRQRRSRPTCAARCRGATSTSRCATSRSRSSSASTWRRRGRRRSAASTATCRRCSRTSQCIECDACVDICPTDCITFTGNGEEADLRDAAARAGAPPRPGALRLERAEDRPRDGQGRGRLPALRPVRRALPDRRLGHAEVPDQADPRRPRLPHRRQRARRWPC